MAQLIKLGNTTVKKPTSFRIETYNITKSGRTASGKMCMDLIAKKRKFFFEYAVLAGADLDVILGIIDSTAMFFSLEYVDNGVTKTATVYGGAIAKDQFRTDGGWYWKNVKFDLIEQ